MRVISGTARGSKLYAPPGLTTRPTSDRIKETLFNIIQTDIPGCMFLDLYSGTGAIGIEALSRGAQKAVLVDSGNESIECIKQNLIKTKLIDRAEIIRADAYEAVKRLSAKNEKFDIVFLDPPYSDVFNLDYIAEAGILSSEGYICIERGISEINSKHFKINRIKEFTKTKIFFLSLRMINE